MDNKLVICIMGQDCKDFLEICLDSVQGADDIVYCDGGSKDDSMMLAMAKGARLIENEFRQDDKDANGRQRNFYLDYLKKEFGGWWALCLDADEVVDDIQKVVKYINSDVATDIASPHMRHLVGDFSQEDATKQVHFVPNRLFKIEKELSYPLGDHVILQERQLNPIAEFTIWHLAYAPLFHVRHRYRRNMWASNVHGKSFLDKWYRQHLFGEYPTKKVQLDHLPPALLKAFDIEPDEIYFQKRGLETKHFIDARDWKVWFQPENVLEWGCGLGPRIMAMNTIGLIAHGIELSQWAVKNSFEPDMIKQGDVTKEFIDPPFDLVIAYDLLEHIDYRNIDAAIDNVIKSSKKWILISVPVIGDSNLEKDPTHLIKESRDYWADLFTSRGCKQVEVPRHFLYRDQLLIFEVPKKP